MTKLQYLSLAGTIAAACLAVTACGPQSSAAAKANTSSSSNTSASTSQAASTVSTPPASAKAAWKQAGSAPAAMMNTYLEQAENDLKKSGGSGYASAESQLAYLASLPATNVSSSQEARAQQYVKALDTFFGTPGELQ